MCLDVLFTRGTRNVSRIQGVVERKAPPPRRVSGLHAPLSHPIPPPPSRPSSLISRHTLLYLSSIFHPNISPNCQRCKDKRGQAMLSSYCPDVEGRITAKSPLGLKRIESWTKDPRRFYHLAGILSGSKPLLQSRNQMQTKRRDYVLATTNRDEK